jgi:hypothetical protein
MITSLLIAMWVAHTVTAVLVVVLARRRVEHRPVALFVVWTLAADLVRAAVMVWGWAPARAALGPVPPLSGWPRVAHHLDQVLLLTWPAGLAALGVVVFLPHVWRSVLRYIALAYAAIVAVLVFTYPANRPMLARTYMILYLAGIVAVVAGAVSWTSRRTRPRPEHATTLILGLLDAALFAGPFAPPAPQPFERWNLAQFISLLTWSALALLHGGFLWGGLLQSPTERGYDSRRLQ